MSDYTIHGLPPGDEIKIEKVVAFKNFDKTRLIGVTDSGAVYTLGSVDARNIDLVGGWNANDKLRRAWCKLTGHKMAEIRAAQKKAREKDASFQRARDERNMRRIADRLGFKVTRMRAKTKGVAA